MNTRILLSAVSLASSAALLVGATFAFFSDVETSSGNTFTAGQLDLKVNGSDVPGTLVTLTAKPGEDTAPEIITLTNTGTNGGIADLHFQSLAFDGGVLTEPECVAEGGVWDPSFTPACRDLPTPGSWVPNNDVSGNIGVVFNLDER
jgi:predicted ribosomally synthesized peptide with SipW-like signal peptide